MSIAVELSDFKKWKAFVLGFIKKQGMSILIAVTDLYKQIYSITGPPRPYRNIVMYSLNSAAQLHVIN